MTDSRSRARNIQDELGKSHGFRKKEMYSKNTVMGTRQRNSWINLEGSQGPRVKKFSSKIDGTVLG